MSKKSKDDAAVLKKNIKDLDKQIEELKEKRQALANQLARLFCPYQVKDVIRKTGRNEGLWVVEGINPDSWSLDGCTLHVRRLNKDGQPGKRTVAFSGRWDLDKCTKIGDRSRP